MAEEKKRELLILLQPNPILNAMIAQMREHGLSVTAATTSDEMTVYLASNLPDFILLPFDHPKYTQILALMTLLKKHYESEVVGYVEKDSAAMLNRLGQSGLKYLVSPPLNARKLELLFDRIVRENVAKYFRIDERRAQIGKKGNASKSRAEDPDKPATTDAESLDAFNISIKQAIDEVVKGKVEKEISHTITAATRINVLPVFSENASKFRGAFMIANAANSDNKTFDTKFRTDLGDLLKLKFRENALAVTTGSWSTMACEPLEAVAWAIAESQSVKTFFLGGEEICLAFFEIPEMTTQLKKASVAGHFLIPASSFEKNVMITFDVSIPAGEPNFSGQEGMFVGSEELEFVQKSGCQNLMISEAALDQYFRYLAEVNLRRRIQNFEFVLISSELKRRDAITEDQQRMKDELITASRVQSSIFPKEHHLDSNVEIRGVSYRASEVSGDWWNYSIAGQRLFLWIGDATGHGVAAALVTSAAKSISTVIDDFPEMPLAKVMASMNNAIGAAGGGKVQMTFFLASLDLKTGELHCVNASHQSPFIFSNQEDNFSRKNVTFLEGRPGARLGEAANSKYIEFTATIQPGDRLFFYTDGITDLKNENGETLGERRFLQAVSKMMSDNPGVTAPVQALNRHIEAFRKSRKFVDDATYFVVQYKPQARRIKKT